MTALCCVWVAVLGVWDVRKGVLPNYLTIGGAVFALGCRLWAEGMHGLADGVAAGAVAGAFLLLPFVMRGAGGGDVKMLCAAGVMAGWTRVLLLLWWMSLAGLVLAVGMLVFKRVDGARLRHYIRCLMDWRYDRKAGATCLPSKDSARERVPFSIAIGAGLVLAMLAKT